MKKKWVFEQLVQDDDDVIGLFAYALYKAEKSECASQRRMEGASEAEVSKAVADFHNSTVSTKKRLDSYRLQANAVFDRIIDGSEQEVRAEYEKRLTAQTAADTKRIEKLEKKLEKASSEAVVDFTSKLMAAPSASRGQRSIQLS